LCDNRMGGTCAAIRAWISVFASLTFVVYPTGDSFTLQLLLLILHPTKHLRIEID
jgi:hypothetical protein